MPNTFYPPIATLDERLNFLADIDTTLQAVLNELINSKAIADTIVQDSGTPTRYFIRQESIDQSTGLTSLSILNLDGSTPSPAPVLPIVPVKSASGNVIDENLYTVAVAGVGYAVGQLVSNVRLFDGQTAAIVASSWFNVSEGLTIASAPPQSSLVKEGAMSSATLTTIAVATTSAIVLPANSLRKGARLVNNSNGTFYGRYGVGLASSTNFSFVLAPLTDAPLVPVGIPSYEEIPSNYVGSISGVWVGASAIGNLLVTEFV